MNDNLNFSKNDVIVQNREKSYFNFNNNVDESKDSINLNQFDDLNNHKINNFDEYQGNMKHRIYSGIQFSKNNLFFKTTPNQIAFDSVIVKNTGTTCIYFKWSKVHTNNSLEERKNDGIDKFFCHYSDSKLSPNEEKEFTFSFFCERNGSFFEDWVLVTNPPIKNTNLNLHINGMCLLIEDFYSTKVSNLNESLDKSSVKTMVKELVIDLVSTIKHTESALPDMSDKEDFEFYFVSTNKQFNVSYSNYIMVLFNDYVKKLFNMIIEERGTNKSIRFSTKHLNEFDNNAIDDLNNNNKSNNISILGDKIVNSNNNNLYSNINTNEDNNVLKTNSNNYNNLNNITNESNKMKDNNNSLNNNSNLVNKKFNMISVNNKENSAIMINESNNVSRVLINNNENNDLSYNNINNALNNSNILDNLNQIAKQNPDLVWKGEINELFIFIDQLTNVEDKEMLVFQLNCLIHLARFTDPEDNKLFSIMKNLLHELSFEFVDENNQLRDEMLLHPLIFDFLSRKYITNDKEVDKYNLELKKKVDEYYKKAKKKPFKNKEEEENETKLYKAKELDKMKSMLYDKIRELNKISFKQNLDKRVLYNNSFNDEYIEFLIKISTITSLTKNSKDIGISLVRVDLNNLDIEYDNLDNASHMNNSQINNNNENNNNTKLNRKIKRIIGLEKTLKSVESLFNKNAKLVVLLVDYGHKSGVFDDNFSSKLLVDYLTQESILEQNIDFEPNIENFSTLNRRVNDDIIKENTLLVVENINFFPEECGFEYYTHVLPPKNTNLNNSLGNDELNNDDSKLSQLDKDKSHTQSNQSAKSKNKSALKVNTGNNNKNSKQSGKQVTIKNSTLNISNNNNESQLDINQQQSSSNEPKIEKTKLNYYTKEIFLNKLSYNIDLYVNDSVVSIKEKYPTILDIKTPKRVMGSRIEDQFSKITSFFNIESSKFLLIVGTDLETNPYSDLYSTLLTINTIMPKFRTIVFLGKIGLMILSLIQKDFDLGNEFLFPEIYIPIIKYIIVKAKINNIELVLPEDIRLLPNSEYLKFHGINIDYYNSISEQLEKISTGKLEINPNDVEIDNFRLDLATQSRINEELNERNIYYEIENHKNRLNNNPFKNEINYMSYYTEVINKLRKREKKAKLIEDSTDADELEEHEEYHLIKLNTEEKELLNVYRNNVFKFNIDNKEVLDNFYNIQEIQLPRKMLKNKKEEIAFQEYLYKKPAVIPSMMNFDDRNWISSEENVGHNRNANLFTSGNYNTNNNNQFATNENNVTKDAKDNKDVKENAKNKSIVKEGKDGKEGKDVKDSKSKDFQSKDNNNNNKNLFNSSINESIIKQQIEEKDKESRKTVFPNDQSLIDYGESTYNTLNKLIKKNNVVMILGELCPTTIKNLFDDYLRFTINLVEAKTEFKKQFEEMVQEDPSMKNLDMTKQRKYLMNNLVKHSTMYETIKECRKKITMATEQDEDAEDQVDEEQLNLDMVYLIDYYIDDKIEVIEDLLLGDDIPGFYVLNENKDAVQKAVELDLKFLDEI